MVVLLPPRGPITPHLLLDSTNQMLTTPSRSSIFYFGEFIELFMPQIHFIVLFYHYLFCCIFWNFIYLYFLHVLYFLHLPIYTSSFCLSNSVSKSIKLSFSCTHVLFILFTRSEDLGILTSHLFASATVSKSYITAGTMIPSCKK